jgi:hypothetical protein
MDNASSVGANTVHAILAGRNWAMKDLIPILVLIAFAGFFAGFSFLISLITGWHELGKIYALSGNFEGKRWHFQNGNMRFGSHYGACLTVGADSTGLLIAVISPLRIGHPPLFIPWSEISVVDVRYFFALSRTQFRFQKAPKIPLYLRLPFARQLREAAGSSWPGDRGDPGAAIQESLRA